MTQVVSSGGDQQDGDVSDGAMVLDGAKAADGGLLHDKGEEAGEEAFDAGAFLVVGGEVRGRGVDLAAPGGMEAEQEVAALLREELGVVGGTDEVALKGLLAVVEWTGELLVGDAGLFRGHAASGGHFEVGRTDDVLTLDSEIGVGLVAGIGCDDGLSPELLEDEGEDLLTVVGGVGTHETQG